MPPLSSKQINCFMILAQVMLESRTVFCSISIRFHKKNSSPNAGPVLECNDPIIRYNNV